MDVILTSLSVKSTLLLTTLVLIGYWIVSWSFKKRPKNLPPGPREWNTNWKILKAFWNDTFLQLTTEWAKKYGPVTFVYSLGQPLAFLNTPEVTRKLFGSDEYKMLFADRNSSAASNLAWYNSKDLIFTPFDSKIFLLVFIYIYNKGQTLKHIKLYLNKANKRNDTITAVSAE